MKANAKNEIAAAINHGRRPHEIRLDARYVQGLQDEWIAWLARRDMPANEPVEMSVVRFLQLRIQETVSNIVRLREGQSNFTRRYAISASTGERRQVILDYARELGRTPWQLRGDQRAFQRWFGPDAMQDRARLGIARAERFLAASVQAVGRISPRVLAAAQDPAAAWQMLALEETMSPLLAWDGDVRVRTDAFRALAAALQSMRPELAAESMNDATAAYIYRAALDRRLDVWIQREALTLLRTLSMDQFARVLEERLVEVSGGDDLFVRRFAVNMLGETIEALPQLEGLFAVAARDPSPFVRQAVAMALVRAPDGTVQSVWPLLAFDDGVQQVRAAALLQLPALAGRHAITDVAIGWMCSALQQESNAFCTRVALHTAEKATATLSGDIAARWIKNVLPWIEQLHEQSPHLPVRRWAAEARERIWCRSDAHAAQVAEHLAPSVERCVPGNARRLPSGPDATHADTAGRVLACMAQRDYGVGLEKSMRGWRLWRGHRFGFRLWRFVHEWQRPSPDKRQAFPHTIGRLFYGTVRAPSAILAELAETKVPGEPLHMASEGGWRPYLPLVDELISLLDENASDGPLRLYTAEGVTEIHAPRGIGRRLAVRSKLTKDFRKFAELRNWVEGSASHPAQYLRAVSELGFAVRFQPYPATRADAAVTRFFPAVAGMPVPELSGRLENYFYSAYDNTLWDLTVFIALSVAGFIGHHIWVNERMRRARNAIPLVVGGWGTRGKSGTERLKAAMFNALGFSVVSKTTGCEAMFLYSQPRGDLREMFLFRPYDKATIWEQMNVVRLAQKLGAEVFLWECMALTPSFVRLLQRAWMRDDISTLTNTFPDHEDLQGPAGVNIPEVMTQFIPRNRVLLTTEEQMRPILQTAADALGTQLKGVGWLESGLIAPDVLARFPYQEHPDNIALVTALGAELGVDADFAVKAMADKVVLDLGVLKTFAPAPVATRQLEFANGMSANERYGCLGNWKRLGFDSQDMDTEPGVVISTVVNNRADRIARSQVFAGVLVEDIRADFHVLIGSNLDGLQGYIRDAWNGFSGSLTLWPDQAQDGGAAGALASLARLFRIPYTIERVSARLGVMLDGIGAPASLRSHAGDADALAAALAPLALPHGDEVIAFHRRDVTMLAEYDALHAVCAQAGAAPDAALDQRMRDQFWNWFSSRIVVVEDYYASGDAVIATIRDATPPGFRNRIMGMQNIKGTGLGFVYRWLSWDVCQKACADLLTRDSTRQRRGLATLGGFQEYGLLTEQTVRATLDALAGMPFGQQERNRAELQSILGNMEAAMAREREKMQSKRSNGWLDKLIATLEGFLDAGDAVRRRRRADRVYADLVQRRISEARAVVELQQLTQRQKGGWLSAAILSAASRFKRPRRRRDGAVKKVALP